MRRALTRPPPPDRRPAAAARRRIRRDHGVTVVAVKRAGEDFTYASAETVLERGDQVIASGRTRSVERFSELT
jgi:trk system potassium uptake protein TrkA